MAKKFKIRSNKLKQKWKLFSYTEDIPGSEMIKGPHIELFSNQQMTVEGCAGVFEYNDNYIKLNLGRGSLIIYGSNFDISNFENSSITIRGKITSVEFCV